jgi:hypothetical protein
VKDKLSTIIGSLSPQCISQNHKEGFWNIASHFLCVGAIRTEETGISGLFRYQGWYRFCDAQEVGPLERFAGGINDPVRSDDQARLRVIDRAITEILVHPFDYPCDIVAIPHRVCLITARKSLAEEIAALMKGTDAENVLPFCSRLKEHLGWLNRLEVCTVTEDIVRTIHSL